MKLKTFLFTLLAVMAFNVSASSQIMTLAHDANDTIEALAQSTCPKIYISNSSYEDVYVYASFIDSCQIPRFVTPRGGLMAIDTYHHGYCHEGLNINIFTYDNIKIYSAFTYAGDTIPVVPGFAQKAMVKK